MSLARKCDRCGKFFELSVVPTSPRIEYHIGLSEYDYDLCLECALDFKSFIGTKENQEE